LRAPPRKVLLAAQLILAAALLYYVGREIVNQWTAIRDAPLAAHPSWTAIVLSGFIVLAVYALLVQTWRVLLAEAGQTLSFSRAAAIWSISNLWRYVPGKLWQIGAMSAMARREQVSAAAAASSAILSTVLNIATGLALVLVLGSRWPALLSPDQRWIALLLIALAALGLAALPFVLPRAGAWAARMTGRDVAIAPPPTRAIAVATVGNLAAWIAYGLAFMWFTRGVLGHAAGATWQYIAVYTASYVAGYLVLLVPGGIGTREVVMMGLITALHLGNAKQAALVAVTSRVWLTILEIAPGLIYLAYDVSRRRSV